MSTPADQLRDQLYQHVLSIPAKASTGMESEASSLDMLYEVMKGFEEGDYDLKDVRSIFKAHVPDFDLDSWLQKQVEAGEYFEYALQDERPDAPEYRSPID